MNNLEKLKTLDAENFWNAVQKLDGSTVREYVDFIAYLNSEDDNLMHFLKSKGECKVVPSEMEIINCLTHGREITESEKRIYISQHTKKAVVLDKMIRFGKIYLKMNNYMNLFTEKEKRSMKNDCTTAEMIAKVIELIEKKNITEFYHLLKTINAYSKKKYEPELSNLVVIYAPYFDCYIKSRKRCMF